ncbi:Nucleotide-binding protein, UspA family [Halapricum desulfuricans]|uniref:Nucleotide-binding protein, UspA family n=1 Tax=Halapricum desulfuricans TaxID=2841257 RepID=A0A897NK15_9EURY|nr:universal stress protein [Halapricum desulfuricans]QSG10616.1 Nucleotide-binding protein, UspA family [Halapricum desulfuricans]
MSRSVLVPTDGGPLSRDALEYAIATFPDATFTLVHVVDPRYTDPDEDELRPERAFTDLLDVAGRHDIEVETEIRVGHPSREIVAVSEDNAVDDIVMGSHGREGASRILLGSIAERVLRRAPVPVTIVRPHQRTGNKHHLVPIDDSDQSRNALEYAVSVFPEVETTILHAIDPIETHYGEGQLVYSETEYERIETEAEQLLANAVDSVRASDAHVSATKVVEWGPNRPADAILDYVEDSDVDHVIMGSHGRSGISRVLLGSVAETVARRSPAPVTVVR